MAKVKNFSQFLDQFAPSDLAESWDNTGLLVGDPEKNVDRLMTCLTVTPESVAEAIEQNVDLIVSHHPMMFRAINRITANSPSGKMLLDLIRNETAVYSPHTAFDSTTNGINELIASKIGLQNIQPLLPISVEQPERGSGRFGELAGDQTLDEFSQMLKQIFDVSTLGLISDQEKTIKKVAIGCGSGGSFLNAAVRNSCDAFVTGEATFHTCLDAQARGLSMFLLGHFSSERFAVEWLSEHLQSNFVETEIWASREEADPVRYV